MLSKESKMLVSRALANVDALLNEFDLGAQIESALPLLHRHRRILIRLRDATHHSSRETLSKYDGERWVDDIVAAYRRVGRSTSHNVLYRTIKELRHAAGRSWPDHAEEAIRQTLQAHCAESPRYAGGEDLFRMIQRGMWDLKNRDLS